MNDFNFVESMAGLAIAKDTNSTYLNISSDFAKLLGWKSPLESQGRTDYEIPCKVAEFADEFIKMDKSAMDSKVQMIALDIQNYATGWKLVLVERNPLLDKKGECIGLFNQCIDVTEYSLFKPYLHLQQIDNKFSKKANKPKSYILSNAHNPLPLTKKQEHCLFLFLRGQSHQEIAKRLQISKSTVESHIEAIKIKLYCYNTSDLIEKAIDSGFLYYIPKEFQKPDLNTIIK